MKKLVFVYGEDVGFLEAEVNSKAVDTIKKLAKESKEKVFEIDNLTQDGELKEDNGHSWYELVVRIVDFPEKYKLKDFVEGVIFTIDSMKNKNVINDGGHGWHYVFLLD